MRWDWVPAGPVAVVRDRQAGTVSATVPATATGFPVKSLREQDRMFAGWGAALSPLAHDQCPVVRVDLAGMVPPRRGRGPPRVPGRRGGPTRPASGPGDRRRLRGLLDQQAPVTVAHEVTLTLTVDVRRTRRRRNVSQLEAAIAALSEEVRLFVARLDAAGITASEPLSPVELSCLVRLRSDPGRGRAGQLGALRHSLAAAAGRGAIEWGPMAVGTTWSTCRVDGSLHRSYRMASMPMLPVAADWLGPLLVGQAATRTVTMVLEPVAAAKAAAAANRQLTSLEASDTDKAQRKFRVTARERRRRADVEDRERELARGMPSSATPGSSPSPPPTPTRGRGLTGVEQAAGQSLVDLRPLAARQGAGWVASLPLGRSVRPGIR